MQSPFLKNDTYCAHDSVAENLHDDLIDSITKKFSDDYFCDGDPFGVRRCGTPPSRFCKLVPNEVASPYFTELVVGPAAERETRAKPAPERSFSRLYHVRI